MARQRARARAKARRVHLQEEGHEYKQGHGECKSGKQKSSNKKRRKCKSGGKGIRKCTGPWMKQRVSMGSLPTSYEIGVSTLILSVMVIVMVLLVGVRVDECV
jgi:hypothetical protein